MEDVGFFEIDFFVCFVKVFGVVDIDVGDDGYIGIDYVDCIQVVVQVDFQDYYILLGIGQQFYDGQGGEFEIGQ